MVNISDSLEVRRILEVLGDPEYDWSTFNGLLKAIDLNPKDVSDILRDLVRQGKVISTIDPKTGDVVFTTKQHYRTRHNFLDDSLSAGLGAVSF